MRTSEARFFESALFWGAWPLGLWKAASRSGVVWTQCLFFSMFLQLLRATVKAVNLTFCLKPGPRPEERGLPNAADCGI